MDERGNLGLEELAEPFGGSYGYPKQIGRQQLRWGRGSGWRSRATVR